MLRHVCNTKKFKTPFHILFKMTLTYQPGFSHYFFIFKQLYKTIPFTAVICSIYIREKKNRDIVFKEIINTMETRPICPQGVFCSGVYYTGIKHTRTVIYGRDVLNKERFVLAPSFRGILHIHNLQYVCLHVGHKISNI
jgi:hypothetical protein